MPKNYPQNTELNGMFSDETGLVRNVSQIAKLQPALNRLLAGLKEDKVSVKLSSRKVMLDSVVENACKWVRSKLYLSLTY